MDQLSRRSMPQPMAPNTPLAATLEAQEWNIVLHALGKLPMEMVRALSDKLSDQLMHAARMLENTDEPPMRVRGGISEG